ncbi:MAG: hypothetical protein WBG92_17730, partial [Thiohalocapsa sp.]
AHPHGELLRSFAPAQVVPRDAPLSEVVPVLNHYGFCVGTAMGDVAGAITRGDMQQPVVRMWLFGIITLMEMELLERIRERWPDGSWTALLSSGRLDKAQTLLDERRRRGQHIDLAHAQDIVTYDWPQIARLARYIEERLRQHDGG